MLDPIPPTASPIRTILVPQGPEYRAVQKGCQRIQAAVSVVPLPPGQAAAARLTRWLQKYRLFAGAGYLLVGLGGGLAPELQVGDPVLCVTTQGMSQPGPIKFDAELNQWMQQRLVGVTVGTAVGSDRILTLASEKQALYQRCGTSVVEMESLSILQVLQQQGKRVAMLRVISDDCRHDLPDISGAIRPDGSLRPLSIAARFVQQPVGAGRLIVGSLKGLATLEEVMVQLFA